MRRIAKQFFFKSSCNYQQMSAVDTPGTISSTRTYRCGVCGLNGHNRRTCPEVRVTDDNQERTQVRRRYKCSRCGLEGHNIRTCPSSEGQIVVQSVLTPVPRQSALPVLTAEVDPPPRELHALHAPHVTTNGSEPTNISSSKLSISTLNTCSVYRRGQMQLLNMWLRDSKTDICFVQDLRLPSNGTWDRGDMLWFYTHRSEQNHAGVGIIVKKGLQPTPGGFTIVDERIAYLRMEKESKRYVLLSAYSPPDGAPADRRADFWMKLNDTIRTIRRTEGRAYLIMGGDFNATVTPEVVTGLVGTFTGSDTMNSNGFQLASVCSEYYLKLASSFNRRSSRDQHSFQAWSGAWSSNLDHVLVDGRMLPGEPVRTRLRWSYVSTDHRMVSVTVETDWTRPRPKPERRGFAWDRGGLARQKEAVAREMINLGPHSSLAVVNGALKQAANKVCPAVYTPRKPWISSTTIQLISERNSIKERRDPREQERLVELIRQCHHAVRDDKRNWEAEKLLEMTQRRKGDVKTLFRTVNVLTCRKGTKKAMATNAKDLKDHLQSISNRPAETSGLTPLLRQLCRNSPVPAITVEEMKTAISELRTGRATGPDGVPAEAVKCLPESCVNLATSTMNMWLKGLQVPEGVRETLIVPLPKGSDLTGSLPTGFRPISLLNAWFKLYESIICKRLGPLDMGESQAGFRSGRSVTDHLFCLNQLIQGRIRHGLPYIVVFLDIAKAYDTLDLEVVWTTLLEEKVIEPQYLRALRGLYAQSRCFLEVNGSRESYTRNLGIPQGAILAPKIFALTMSIIAKRVRGDEPGVRPVLDFLFVDDTAFASFDASFLQETLSKFCIEAAKFNLRVNPSKCQLLTNVANINLEVEGIPLIATPTVKYLGVVLSADGSPQAEYEARLRAAQKAYFAMDAFFRKRSISTSTKVQVFTATVEAVLCYQSCLWTTSPKMIEVFQRQGLRRLVRGFTPPHVRPGPPVEVIRHWRPWPNSKLFSKSKATPIIAKVRRSRLSWLAHVYRMGPERLPLKFITRGFVVPVGTKRKQGGTRRSWLEWAERDLGLPINRAKQLAQDRARWKRLI